MKHLYMAHEQPNLVVNTSGGELVFKHGSLTLDDENEKEAAQIAELDEALATNPSVSSLVAKVDREAAERAVQEHLERERAEQEARQSISGVAGTHTMQYLEQGPEILPKELRGMSGSGSVTDGLRLDELAAMLKEGDAGPQAPGAV